MIAHLVAAPMITFADVKYLFLETLGAPIMHASRKHYRKGYHIYKPENPKSNLARNFVYAGSVQDFLMLEERLASDETEVCVLIGDSIPVIEEYSLAPSYVPMMTVQMVNTMVDLPRTYAGLPDRVRKTAQTMLEDSTQDLLLPKIHPLFYRIADKTRREKARDAAFSYLTGMTRKYTLIGVPALDRLLESDLATRTRDLVQQVLSSSLDEVLEKNADADEFELRYLVAKHAELGHRK